MAGRKVAGNHRESVDDAALGYWDSDGRRNGNGGGYAWNDRGGNRRIRKRLHLFKAAPKDEGIAPLKAGHLAAGTGVLDEQLVDLFLRD